MMLFFHLWDTLGMPGVPLYRSQQTDPPKPEPRWGSLRRHLRRDSLNASKTLPDLKPSVSAFRDVRQWNTWLGLGRSELDRKR